METYPDNRIQDTVVEKCGNLKSDPGGPLYSRDSNPASSPVYWEIQARGITQSQTGGGTVILLEPLSVPGDYRKQDTAS